MDRDVKRRLEIASKGSAYEEFAEELPAPLPSVTRRSHATRRQDLYEPRRDLADVDLYGFITRVSPGLAEPRHLAPIVDAFEQIASGKSSMRVVFSAPTQHGKSTLVNHGCAYVHTKRPDRWIQYVTYEQTFSEVNARNIRRIEESAGVSISSEHNTVKGWTIDVPGQAVGGEFVATSVDGRSSGLKANLLVIDDPFKGPDDAFSPTRRDAVYDALRWVWTPRLAPGYSIFVVASRWHEDDLSGRCIRDGFDEVRLEAMNESDPSRPFGEPLCAWGPDPKEPRDLAFLEDLRYGKRGKDGIRRGGMGEYAWSALMQGKPLPPDAAIFKQPQLVDMFLPHTASVIGADLAFSPGSRSDFAVLLRAGMTGSGVMQVYDVWRGKLTPQEYMPKLFEWRDAHQGLKMYSYTSGVEKAIILSAHMQGIPIFPLEARYSKASRAQKAAQAWNEGRILLPRSAPWLDAFTREICGFTGSNNDHDDQVDALVAAYDMLAGVTLKSTFWTGGARAM